MHKFASILKNSDVKIDIKNIHDKTEKIVNKSFVNFK